MSLALGEVKLICEAQDGEMIIAEGYMDEVKIKLGLQLRYKWNTVLTLSLPLR